MGGYTKSGAIRVVGVAMLVVFRPFVFRKRKSLKRGLRDTDSVCDAQATSPERAATQH